MNSNKIAFLNKKKALLFYSTLLTKKHHTNSYLKSELNFT